MNRSWLRSGYRGQGVESLAMIQSYAMMLRYSFDMGEDADLLEQAVTCSISAAPATSCRRAAAGIS